MTTVCASAKSPGAPSAAKFAARICVTLAAAGTCTILMAANQTISFPPFATQSLSSGPVPVTATASSGLMVLLSSLTPSVCAVGGGNLAVLRAIGTCTIRASQPGNATYSAATDVDQGFAITKGTQTITFSPVRNWMLTALPDPLFATASSGLPVAFSSLSPAVCAVTGNQVTLIAAGACAIRASQSGNANYTAAANVDQTFLITGGNRAIAFTPIGDKALNASPVLVSASVASGGPVTFSSLTATTCTVSGSLVTVRAVGACTIRATQPADATNPVTVADETFNVVATQIPQLPPPPVAGPLVEYSTYLGGFGGDSAFDVAVAPDGSALVAGYVASTNFPGVSSTAFTNTGLDMTFVAKLNPNGGTQDFATIVGGRAPDMTGSGAWSYVGAVATNAPRFLGGGQVEAIAADGAGNLYVAAYDDSAAFPSRGGAYVRAGGKYIFKVTPAGAVQRVSAAIDPAVMTIRALAVDASGALYLSGVAGPGLITTAGALLPAMPAPGGVLISMSSPYLIKLAAGGATTAFATYLSRPGARAGMPDTVAPQSLLDAATTAYTLAVDAAGNAYVAGQATSDQFPVTAGSPDTGDTQHRDAFIAKVNATGTALVFVARLGGFDADRATSIALSPDGGIVVGGKTASEPFFGTANSFQRLVTFRPQTPYDERETGFVAKLAADGKSWNFVATLGTDGGTLVDGFEALPIKVAVDAAGDVYAAGTSSPYRDLVMIEVKGDVSSGGTLFRLDNIIPAANALSGVDSEGAFAMKISRDGARLLYLAVLGGASVATGLALDNFGNAYVAGRAQPDLMVVNAGQGAPAFDGQKSNAFVAKINDHLVPVALTTDRNPSAPGQAVSLRAVVADARFAGTIEFDDGAQVLGSVAIASGAATFSATLSVGIHRLRVVFRGSGPFNGYVSSELIQVVNQNAPGP